MSPVLDPERPVNDAFLDAVLGLDNLCRALGLALDGAIPSRDDSLRGSPDDLVDALLGLVSVRTTIALILGAAVGVDATIVPVDDAPWSRELLR